MSLLERWAALSSREKILIGLAGAVALVMLVRYSPLAELRSSIDEGEDSWVQLQKIENYQKIVGRREAGANQRTELEKRYKAAQDKLIVGSTPTQIGAALQGTLSNLADDAGLSVLSSQILKEDELDGFKRVGVRLTLSGQLDGVSQLLRSIETGRHSLTVQHLEINRKLGASRRPTTPAARAAAERQKQAPLTATLEIRTFMQAPL